MKKIRVYRDTGWVGMLGGIRLKLNGSKSAKIYNKEWLELPLVEEEAVLQTDTFGQKSNTIQVVDGNDYILSTTFWGSYGFGFMILLTMLSSLLRNTFLYAATMIFAIIILVTGLIPGLYHKLEKYE